MSSGARLVIKAIGNRYARFYMDKTEFWCEIVYNDQVAGERRMTPQSEEILLSQGWRPPEKPRVLGWYRAIDWPAHHRDYETVARQVATALHRFLRVETPTQLTVKAWIDNSQDSFNTSALELRP
ncbi:hypothetical protein APR08_004666 [Nocardia amikacinitolerans]|nr:hypothetical protein [Nocardia amikacinitolerans]